MSLRPRLRAVTLTVTIALVATLVLSGAVDQASADPTADRRTVGLVAPVSAAPVRTAPGEITTTARPKVLLGADVSWPECPKGSGVRERPGQGKPMPSASHRFLVVGLTNGMGFTPNPCLARQLDWAKSHHVRVAPYAFTTYPTTSQQRRYRASGPYRGSGPRSRLRNAGYAQAVYNIATLRRSGLHAPMVWVDVEPSTARPWSRNHAANRAVFAGNLRAYREAGYRVGVYSTSYLWRDILGPVRYGLPEWRTAGRSSRRAALRMCSRSGFQGGRAVLAQWWTTSDHDVTCPGYATTTNLKRYFHRY